MTPPHRSPVGGPARTLNEAMAELHAFAKDLALDIDVRIRVDGRVQFEFVNLAGYVVHTIRADVFPGGSHPSPGEALAAMPLTIERRKEPA